MYRMVFTQIFCWLIIIIGSCCFLSGCAPYKTVRIETLEPAQVFLDGGDRIAFLDRNIFFQPDSPRVSFLPKRLANSFSDGLSTGLMNAMSPTEPIILENTEAKRRKEQFSQPLDYQQVARLCSKFKIDYIVSLENHFLEFKDQTYQYNWIIRLYHDGSSTPIDSCVSEKKSILKTDGSMNELLDVSWENGMKYAERIKPYWKEDERRVYRKGKALHLGYVFFRAGQLEEAIQMWSAARQVSPEQAVRASFNLAWLYENSGDMETAAQILKEADQQAKGQDIKSEDADYLKKYLKRIEQRIENIKLLDNQIKKDTINEQL